MKDDGGEASTHPPDSRVLLIGMMGAGKSTVGRALARATGWPYVDSDVLVARACGLATRRLLEERGVDELRRVESAALHAVLHLDPPVIAGVAAGAVTRSTDRQLLTGGDGFVVWLRARLETLERRVGSGGDRPWLAGRPGPALRELWEGRAALYAKVAQYIVDVDDRTPEEAAETILAELRRRASTD